ncbi:MAG: 2-hydroxyglutaryl-CoA dehydratase [Deltaproteobacteria bacterium]|nr:2-hydroxyglutaryl-CoA dehydratase [Deltaproteobacteria bacterium]MBW1923806.1 2-hydroxyglutaryl-CoA dehydratase [Deltaproteobacteria bacterium]MBW1949310.1 2-hydroxyglutaryl-CoA dehydratase [Deltaproteobacteria bacterium]MBW2009104.1 2-hydroxyglutaryl-CoA dehydratase [Deltaproteobacteria bacterium]MBW2102679.1 2-hydroxyglutaryl-CoA dehydratase [Deltaproteobacteria bacterium]
MRFWGGIDVGSLSADAVIIDEEGRLLGHAILPTGRDSREAGSRAYAGALEAAGLTPGDVVRVYSTGYSRARVREAEGAKTEIACHARGAHALYPDVGTIIDIGGQDSKAIQVGKGGRVLNFVMNDKCAAGTGRFLEVMAGALETPLDHLDELAAQSTETLTISSICTVFAESEVVSLISQGKKPADIAMAVSRAIARRTVGLATRVGVSGRVVMTGGVAKNRAVVDLLAEILGAPVDVPDEPQIVGALGAALFARDERG